jgi:hypothetical protein
MEKLKIGLAISFGGYNWRILDIQNGRALIITEDIIERRAYHDAYENITWAGCALRKYLNGEFYEKFSVGEKSKIIQALNKNPKNPWYGSEGGADTEDKIFILSIEEAVCKYFGDSSANLFNRNEKQKYWFERKDENNHKRCAKLKEGEWWYWLRSPGRVNVKAAYIKRDGIIGIQGNNILKGNISEGENNGGVRPSMWIRGL